MIGIIVPGNKKYTPYIQNYIDVLNEKHCDYKVMSWNKTGLQEDEIDLSFNYTVKDSDRKRMLWGYIRFTKVCKKYIKSNGIDKLIILTVAPAFFFGLRYLTRFKGEYILDIRDDSPLVRRFPGHFKKICALARTVVVSSDEFTPWTGRETVLCHNADLEQLRLHKNDTITDKFKTPTRIVFAGVMIEGPCNVEVLKSFQNDIRFEHIIIGRDSSGKQLIQDYVASSGMTNVVFEGAYNKNEIIDIYREKADLINIFRARTTVNRNALPNKLYEAVLAGRPIIVFEHNLAIAKYAKKYNLGIIIPDNLDVGLNDFVFERLKSFNFREYEEGRKVFLEEVEKEMKRFVKSIELFSSR